MISSSFFEKIYYKLLLIISIGIGLQISVYKIGLIALFLACIFHENFFRRFYNLKINKYAIVLLGIFFLYLMSLLWSENYVFAIKDLILKSPLLLFPLILSTQHKINRNQQNNIFLGFLISSLVINIVCFVLAFLPL